VTLLLEEGCDPHQPDKQGRLALEIACENGGPPVSVIRQICQKMRSLEPTSTKPRTGPIQWLCKRRDLEIAAVILEYGILLDRIDDKGYQGTYYLIGAEDENVAVAILDKLRQAGYDVNAMDKKERTLLEILADRVCWEYRPKMVEWLIRHGAHEKSIAKALGDNRYKKKRVVEILSEMESANNEG
jgi:ankyrin repeat protein